MEHIGPGHIGPQQLLQEEVGQHVTVLLFVILKNRFYAYFRLYHFEIIREMVLNNVSLLFGNCGNLVRDHDHYNVPLVPP